MKKGFFDSFKCKCGECRSSCCKNWNVTIGLEEYFHLINLDCKDHTDIRRKIDCAFVPCDYPTKERYVMIKKNYQGDCVFHDVDGLCMIHKYFGEENIANVCKMYPRSASLGKYKSLSNSCEKVIEMLIETENPTFYSDDEKDDSNLELQKIIDKLSDRKEKLGLRLVRTFNIKTSHQDYCNINKLVYDFLKYYQNRNDFIYKIVVNECLINNYSEKKKLLYSLYPNIDIYIEKLLINHLVFKNYPKQIDERIRQHKELLVIGVYIIIKYVLYSIIERKDDIYLVDSLSKLFRVLEHSNFDLSFGIFMMNNDKQLFLEAVENY